MRHFLFNHLMQQDIRHYPGFLFFAKNLKHCFCTVSLVCMLQVRFDLFIFIYVRTDIKEHCIVQLRMCNVNKVPGSLGSSPRLALNEDSENNTSLPQVIMTQCIMIPLHTLRHCQKKELMVTVKGALLIM